MPLPGPRLKQPSRTPINWKITVNRFFGVPLILKGLGQDFAGAPATFGSRFFAKAKSEHTNNFVKALQRLGFIIVGQSNVPEFGFKNITDAELYGPAVIRGTATIRQVALPVAQQRLWLQVLVRWQPVSDGGGSIRIPASFPA